MPELLVKHATLSTGIFSSDFFSTLHNDVIQTLCCRIDLLWLFFAGLRRCPDVVIFGIAEMRACGGIIRPVLNRSSVTAHVDLRDLLISPTFTKNVVRRSSGKRSSAQRCSNCSKHVILQLQAIHVQCTLVANLDLCTVTHEEPEVLKLQKYRVQLSYALT